MVTQLYFKTCYCNSLRTSTDQEQVLWDFKMTLKLG